MLLRASVGEGMDMYLADLLPHDLFALLKNAATKATLFFLGFFFSCESRDPPTAVS